MPGVSVRIGKIGEARDGADLDAMLESGEVDNDAIGSRWYHDPALLGPRRTWTTDSEGRFEIFGIGRDRIACLELDDPKLEHTTLYAMARNAKAPTSPRTRPRRSSQPVLRFPAPHLVAATFEQIIGPCKPVVGVVRLKGSGKPLAGVRIYGYGRTPPVRVETQTDADGRFRLLGLPKSGSYEIRAAPRSGVDPFLGTTITITDTAGLEPIEAVLELPKGVIVAGRVIDSATGRPERVHELNYSRLPTNWNEGDTATGHSGATDPTFRITVPPGEGVIRTQVRGWETPYSCARLRPADQEKLGGDEEFRRIYSKCHAYRIIEVPVDAESFTADLELTRGLTRRVKVVGPDGQPVTGARCYGVSPTWGYIKTLDGDTFEILGLESGGPRLIILSHQTAGWWVRSSSMMTTSSPTSRWSSTSCPPVRSRVGWSTRTACPWRAPGSGS